MQLRILCHARPGESCRRRHFSLHKQHNQAAIIITFVKPPNLPVKLIKAQQINRHYKVRFNQLHCILTQYDQLRLCFGGRLQILDIS